MLERLLAFFRPAETRALDSASAWMLIPAGVAGGAVGPAGAMTSPTAAACVRAISEAVATMPVHAFRRSGDARERVRDLPAAAVLDRANPWTSFAALATQVMADALLHDTGGFIRAVRVRGAVTELHRLPPGSVAIEEAPDGSPGYRVTTAGRTETLTWRDVIHIATPGWTPDRQHSARHHAREAIALDLEMSGHALRTFRNGGRPSGVLKVPGKIGHEGLERLKTSWAQRHAGDASGSTAVLEEGTSFEPLASSFVDAQFLEQRRLVIEDIARGFRVPPMVIGDLTRATYSNGETMGRLFVDYTLTPWMDVWIGQLERVLLTDDERGEYFLEFQTGALLQADTAARFAALRSAIGGAWLTPNEARAIENRPPVDGGDELIRQAGQAGATDGNTPTDGGADGVA